jgi:hypothetical protein
MTKVILDAATVAKLRGANERLELYDEAGNLLGYMTPAFDGLMDCELPGPDPCEDEAMEKLLKNHDPGRPLKDILDDLRNR